MNRIDAQRVLELRDIRKAYGTMKALDGITLDFSANRIYGLFGRNGAGKTTLLDIITSRIFPDAGTVRFRGEDTSLRPGGLAENCCYMPEKHYFPPKMRVGNILELGKASFSRYSDSYADALCGLFGLNIDRRYEALSRGHQSALRIVLGLASRAPVTIFDEPVLGLDAAARDDFYRELIEEFAENPRLFIISTHLIEEAADLFNEAIIIDKGRIIRNAPVEELLSRTFRVSGKKETVDAFLRDRAVLHRQEVGGMSIAVVEGTRDEAIPNPELDLSSLTMQKLFIHLTENRNEVEE